MPCLHKFKEDLRLERLDFAPETLVVGTFNPAWPEENSAAWFYGRTQRNFLWDVLPRLYPPFRDLRKDGPQAWKQFCRTHRIAFTDIVSAIRDADPSNEGHRRILGSFSDTDLAGAFSDFEFTDLRALLVAHPTIRHVYLTRQPGVELFDRQWAQVVEFRDQYPERSLRVCRLITPSAGARFAIRSYKQAHPDDLSPLRNFIHARWKEVWHEVMPGPSSSG